MGSLIGVTNITASGVITGEHLFSTDDAQINDDVYVGGDIIHLGNTDTKISFDTDSITLFPHITASGNISASGELIGMIDGGSF